MQDNNNSQLIEVIEEISLTVDVYNNCCHGMIESNCHEDRG